MSDSLRGPTSGSPGGVGAGLDTSEGRAFLRERLALFGKTIFILAGAFWLIDVVSAVINDPPPGQSRFGLQTSLPHLAGVLTMGALWLIARRTRKLRALGIVDGATVIVTCLFWAGMIRGGGTTAYISLLASMATVTARAAIVPSSAWRSFWLTTIALLPSIVGAALFPMPGLPAWRMTLGAAQWVALSVACATLISRTIYGLRQRVKAATELGQYSLDEKIGGGGMGEVWRAHHRLLIRPAAIKIVRPKGAGTPPGETDTTLRRFEREARATAALRSPHTVQLYDFGVSDDGTFYYVMELLEGFDLEQLVSRFGPQPPERAVHILVQVCSSLSDAHKNGLVHRDIKPANIFMIRAGHVPDFAKVLDFGLVKLDRPALTNDVRLTAEAGLAGTPAFIAPEVVLGEGPTDHRVDLYSLGCVAYWLLTGKLVFEGPGAMRVMLDHAHTPPPPPSTRCEQPIPAALEELILACLEREPGRRPASADELADRLLAIPLPAWTKERAAEWWRRHGDDTRAQRPIADMLLSHEQRPRTRLVRKT